MNHLTAVLMAAALAAPAPTPVPIPDDKARVLLEQQQAVDVAIQAVAVTKEHEAAERAKMASLVNRAALELRLDLDTHETTIEPAGPGKWAFGVKPAPRPTPTPEAAK